MSNEQKLREALQEAATSLETISRLAGRGAYPNGDDTYMGTFMEVRGYATSRAGVARQALATTEPEPTGLPELHPVAHIELGDDSHDVVTLEAAKAYGEQCWKAGYKHGAWADKPEPTSKQSLQVEPAVNQQLTTEPVDEREVFEKVFPTPSHCKRCGDGYAATSYNAWEAHNHIERWKGWQARAAMAKGVK